MLSLPQNWIGQKAARFGEGGGTTEVSAASHSKRSLVRAYAAGLQSMVQVCKVEGWKLLINTAIYRNVCHVISREEVFLAIPLFMSHIRVKTSLKMTLTFRVKEPSSRLGGLACSSENATTMCCRATIEGAVLGWHTNQKCKVCT